MQLEVIDIMLRFGANAALSLEEIIILEIEEFKNSEELELMLSGHKYYSGDNDILKKKRMVVGDGGELEEAQNLANNKLVHNFIRKLVDQKIGYLLSRGLGFQTDNEQYSKLLNTFFNNSFQRILQNIGKEAVNKGKAWLHIYYNAQGDLSFKRIPAEEIIPLWQDAEHTMLDAVIRVYELEAYEGNEKSIITKVEFWSSEGVKRYVLDEDKLIPDVELGEESGHFSLVSSRGEQAYNWERIPFVCFKYNDEELPLIKFIKSLVDDYDNQKSDNANNLEDLPNSIYVIRNYDGADLGEFRRNLSVFRVVKVSDEGGVETLSLEINTEAYQNHMQMNRKDIYEFGRGVDTQSDRFGNDQSGIALKFLYADLDMDADMMETEFQASLEQLIWFIDQHINNTTGKDYSDVAVDFIFDRDILINESDTIESCQKSIGVISQETIVANHPWVVDTATELKRLEEEQSRKQEEWNEYRQAFLGADGNEE